MRRKGGAAPFAARHRTEHSGLSQGVARAGSAWSVMEA
ncbi:hypothetical protein A176_004366 [Myxococcus hansupus]|uniref:Uncharacterized protein n=1 Tax=Pseudomyxococcus hansupus TaxID=1297742 RepID=A0A0H4WXA3_9BACT|nr:hypothetical protein A176_004366 [Myxococcus hansupus]